MKRGYHPMSHSPMGPPQKVWAFQPTRSGAFPVLGLVGRDSALRADATAPLPVGEHPEMPIAPGAADPGGLDTAEGIFCDDWDDPEGCAHDAADFAVAFGWLRRKFSGCMFADVLVSLASG